MSIDNLFSMIRMSLDNLYSMIYPHRVGLELRCTTMKKNITILQTIWTTNDIFCAFDFGKTLSERHQYLIW